MRRVTDLRSPSRRAVLGALGAATLIGPRRAWASTGRVEGQVRVFRKKRARTRHDGVVVYLEGVPGARTSIASAVHEIRQIDRAFVPQTSAVLVGTTLTFPNDDHIVHNVFSTSEAGSFDLGAYKHGTTRSFRTHKPGEIRIYCNMHAEMEANVLVLTTDVFALSDREGSFKLPPVPPGRYRYVAWQPHGAAAEGEVSVEAGAVETLKIELIEIWPPRHRRKDGSHYDEY